MNSTVSDRELQAYVDGRLDAERRRAVECWLGQDSAARARVEAYRQQHAMLHGHFDPILEEPVPARLLARRIAPDGWSPLRRAAVIAWLAVGAAGGWWAHEFSQEPAGVERIALPRQAALAHVVYTPEIRHPVEVGADQEAHLVAWLSKRLDTPLRVPNLVPQGYSLVGGRLLPGSAGPAAQFMYQAAQGGRLTLYVQRHDADPGETAFRYAEEKGLGVFYWVDGGFGYALSGGTEREALLAAAEAVYHQLNP